MNVLSLFSGIGGLELGLERAGMTTVGQVEIDPWCRSVLAKHWPEVPRHDDVRTAIEWWRSAARPRVDLVGGGFPCQPVSQAGQKKAQADPRWLWEPMRDVIHDLRPTWVVGENVPGLLRRGLAAVHDDLERLGYVVRTGAITACAMGAPHARERLFVLAHSTGLGRCPWGMTLEALERRLSNSKTGARLGEVVGGPLNPTWIEWLMGFPEGWTDVSPSATPSSRRSPSTSDD